MTESDKKLKIFLSWSNTRSRAIAQVLLVYLEHFNDTFAPWMSSEIEKGANSSDEIHSALSDSLGAGIICLTADNLNSPWLHYEAGYLASFDKARVMTLLFEVTSADVKRPLANTQNTVATDKDDFRKLLTTLNNLAPQQVKAEVLDIRFENFWPKIEQNFIEIKSTAGPVPVAKRSEADLLAEVLTTVRRIENDLSAAQANRFLDTLGNLRLSQGVPPTANLTAQFDSSGNLTLSPQGSVSTANSLFNKSQNIKSGGIASLPTANRTVQISPSIAPNGKTDPS